MVSIPQPQPERTDAEVTAALMMMNPDAFLEGSDDETAMIAMLGAGKTVSSMSEKTGNHVSDTLNS